MDDLTKKTLSVMLSQLKNLMKGIVQLITWVLLFIILIIDGGKLLQWFWPDMGDDDSIVIMVLSCSFIFFICFILYLWYMETKDTVNKYSKRGKVS